MREIHPDRGLALRQDYRLLLLLLLDERHELLVSVHVDDGGGGRHNDAGEEVEEHGDWSVQKQGFIFVQNILWSHHMNLVHDRHGGEGHQVLDTVANQLDGEQERDSFVCFPED